MALFKDRLDAGQQLAKQLSDYANREDVIVLGLPRGGVPVAFEVAKALGVSLDIFLVRKLGVPGHEELALGAIASGGVQVLNEEVVKMLNLSREQIADIAAKEQAELRRREQMYRGEQAPPSLRNRQTILVDDGLATGASMWAAVAALRAQEPARTIVAVPTAPPETCAAFEEYVDDIICAQTPRPFFGVGRWYENFSQTTDREVQELLERGKELSLVE